MVTKKATGKNTSVPKLKLKKDTIKDLDVKGKAVKGGNIMMTAVTCRQTCACLPPTVLKPTIICG